MLQLFNSIVNLTTALIKFCVFWSIFFSAGARADSFKAQDLLPDSNLKQTPGSIVLKHFDVVGNRTLPDSEIDALLKPYLFRPISFAELFTIQQKITQLFIARGYLTSGAYIPPQTITDRTVKIQIIEGRIEDIKIYGLKHLRPEYVRSRIKMETEPPLNRDKLLNALQLLQLNPRIDSISAELSPGIDPGESLLEIEIEEANAFNAELTFNNYQAVSVGSQSRELILSDDNVLGFGDRFAVNYINTPSSNSLAGLSYTFPLSARR